MEPDLNGSLLKLFAIWLALANSLPGLDNISGKEIVLDVKPFIIHIKCAVGQQFATLTVE